MQLRDWRGETKTGGERISEFKRNLPEIKVDGTLKQCARLNVVGNADEITGNSTHNTVCLGGNL